MLPSNYLEIFSIHQNRAGLLCYHPLINPRVNPADILPVRGIPKLVIANEEAIAAVWTSPPLLLLIYGICVSAFESVVIAPSQTC
jgi:hypothetical protein